MPQKAPQGRRPPSSEDNYTPIQMDSKEAPGESTAKETHREVRGAEGQGDREKPYSEGRVSKRERAIKRGHIREQREHEGMLSK